MTVSDSAGASVTTGWRRGGGVIKVFQVDNRRRMMKTEAAGVNVREEEWDSAGGRMRFTQTDRRGGGCGRAASSPLCLRHTLFPVSLRSLQQNNSPTPREHMTRSTNTSTWLPGLGPVSSTLQEFNNSMETYFYLCSSEIYSCLYLYKWYVSIWTVFIYINGMYLYQRAVFI